MRLLRRVAIIGLLVACFSQAQVDRANLSGTVTDSSGAVVPLANVEVTGRDTGLKRVVESRSTGAYTLTGLPIGAYDLRFSHQGFRTVEVLGVQLSVGETRTIDVRLEV